MKQSLQQISLAVPALLIALSVLTVAPVFASHGSDDKTGSSSSSGSGSGSSGSSSDDNTQIAVTTTSVKADDDSSDDVGDDNPSTLRQKGKEHAAELAQNRKSSKTEERTARCESHKQGIEKKFSNIVKNSESYESKVSDILAKAQAYQAKNNVSATDYDSLVAAADAAKADVDTAIANLKEVKPSLDCNNVSVAQDVATFKVAADETRGALKDYRMAVKAVIKSLLDAKNAGTHDDSTDSGSSTDDSSTGGTN